MPEKIVYYGAIGVSILLLIGTLLSVLDNTEAWYLKALDFPRLQFLFLACICLTLILTLKNGWDFTSIAVTLGLAAVVAIQATYIIPYTFLGKKTVSDARPAQGPEGTVGILVANVLMTNRQADRFLEIVKQTNPDMVLAMETDQWWVNQLEPLKKDFPYTMVYPLNNTYGMALYSSFPLEEKQIRFLEYPDVPSFHARVQLPSGEVFIFHGMHPVPPAPRPKLPGNVKKKEVALLQVGKMVAQSPLPDVVAGDYNDVSWSNTSRLFEAGGNLNNVRLGRGLYNSFNARLPVFRWPLDHFFVTGDFSVLELKRLPKFNSDHFPVFVRLALRKPFPSREPAKSGVEKN